MYDPLSLESRKRIFEFISSRPGTHVREIEKNLGMPSGHLSYHLDVLRKENLVSAEDDGYRLRYFPARGFIQKNRLMVSILRQEQLRKIVLLVLRHGKPSFHTLQIEMGLSKSTISHHIKKLVIKDILKVEKVEREVFYMAVDPELLINALVIIEGGMESTVEDQFAEIWREIRPRGKRLPSSTFPAHVQRCQDIDGDHTGLKGQ